MKKILVLEDDNSIRELLVDILETEGYFVQSCINGLEGLKKIAIEIPDIIVMDIMMPIMNGYEFRQELSKHPSWSSIPVLAMSAQDQTNKKLEEHGIYNFISKPIELNQLLETVKSLS